MNCGSRTSSLGTGELVAIDALAPVWSQDGKAIAYHYIRIEHQAADRESGGPSRWEARSVSSAAGSRTCSSPPTGAETGASSAVMDLILAMRCRWRSGRRRIPKPRRRTDVLIAKPKTGFWQAQILAEWPVVELRSFDGRSPRVPRRSYVATADASRPERWSPDCPGSRLARQTALGAGWSDPLFPLTASDVVPQPLGRPVRPRARYAGWPTLRRSRNSSSPTLSISPDAARSEMDVSARHTVLTMKTATGSIWMLDNVDS